MSTQTTSSGELDSIVKTGKTANRKAKKMKRSLDETTSNDDGDTARPRGTDSDNANDSTTSTASTLTADTSVSTSDETNSMGASGDGDNDNVVQPSAAKKPKLDESDDQPKAVLSEKEKSESKESCPVNEDEDRKLRIFIDLLFRFALRIRFSRLLCRADTPTASSAPKA